MTANQVFNGNHPGSPSAATDRSSNARLGDSRWKSLEVAEEVKAVSTGSPFYEQCTDGVATGDSHEANRDGRCHEHFAQYQRWRGRRNKAVERGTHTRASYPAYDPQPRSLRARGVVTLTPEDARLLRLTVDDLLDAKLSADGAHRDNRRLGQRGEARLLAALEEHLRIVNRLLRPRRPS